MKTWKEEIIDALTALGGKAGYEEIYKYIESHSSRTLTKQWKASVRNAMETFSSDSDNYNGSEDIFYSGGIGSGIWGLRNINQLTYVISSGKYQGKPLFPHKNKNGQYIVSTSKFEEDHIYVDSLEEVKAFIKAGYKLRMANEELDDHAPSLISPRSIQYAHDTSFNESIDSTLTKLANQDSLDTYTKGSSRKEQALLRANLIGNATEAECTLCGKQVPIQFLVAAHIKKRSKCTVEEKLDFSRIVTLMCKLGCDDLFEYGYVYEGIVHINPKKKATPDLKGYMESIEGRDVSGWTISKNYYEWHAKNVAEI